MHGCDRVADQRRTSRVRSLARTGLAASVVLLVVACGADGPPIPGDDRQPAQLERYTDAHGWSIEYPSDMHLERSHAQLRIFV